MVRNRDKYLGEIISSEIVFFHSEMATAEIVELESSISENFLVQESKNFNCVEKFHRFSVRLVLVSLKKLEQTQDFNSYVIGFSKGEKNVGVGINKRGN